jgi:hypothetical protein
VFSTCAVRENADNKARRQPRPPQAGQGPHARHADRRRPASHVLRAGRDAAVRVRASQAHDGRGTGGRHGDRGPARHRRALRLRLGRGIRPGVPVRTRRQPGPTHGKAHLLDDHPARRLCRGGGGRPRHRAEDQAAADHRRSAPRPSNGEPGSPPPGPASATVAEAGWRALSRSGIRLRPGLAAGCSAGVGRHPTTLDVRIRGCHDCRRATGRLPAHRFGAPRREAGGQRHRWVGVSSPAVGRAAGATWGR